MADRPAERGPDPQQAADRNGDRLRAGYSGSEDDRHTDPQITGRGESP
nr:MAG TPA: hypothetical protein [Caudoviricetes sp.]